MRKWQAYLFTRAGENPVIVSLPRNRQPSAANALRIGTRKSMLFRVHSHSAFVSVCADNTMIPAPGKNAMAIRQDRRDPHLCKRNGLTGSPPSPSEKASCSFFLYRLSVVLVAE